MNVFLQRKVLDTSTVKESNFLVVGITMALIKIHESSFLLSKYPEVSVSKDTFL